MIMSATYSTLKKAAPACAMSLLASNAHAAGLPQLDHTWYANQLLWLVVSFGLLYTVVSCIVAPSINSVLKTRSSAIDDAIREAERAKEMAESTKSNAESANLDARNQASAFLAKAQAETSANALEALAKLDHDLAKKLSQADVRIEDTKNKALSAINAATVSLASAMASKLLGHAVSDADVQPVVAGLAKASEK